ncbi:hypothetical protein [Enterococcus dispar]
MAKKIEETIEKEETKKEETKKEEVKTVEFRVAKEKNFVGFTHPKTRRFVTGDKDGKFFIRENDADALKILREAADIVEI